MELFYGGCCMGNIRPLQGNVSVLCLEIYDGSTDTNVLNVYHTLPLWPSGKLTHPGTQRIWV